MAIELTHTQLDNSIEVNNIPGMYPGPVMQSSHIRPQVRFNTVLFSSPAATPAQLAAQVALALTNV